MRLPPRPARSAEGQGLPRRNLLLSGAALLTECTMQPDRDHTGPDAPRAEPLRQPVRTAWVFSSGGPRGFVHVGVLKTREELGLAPDLIVGASGLCAAEIKAVALEVQPLSLARWDLGAEERLSCTAVADLVRQHSRVPLLERIPVPMACVAARRSDGAATASPPVTWDWRCRPRPPSKASSRRCASAASNTRTPTGARRCPCAWRALGAQRVLAVDATAHIDSTPPCAERYREGDLRKKALVDADDPLATLLLKPDFGYRVSLSRDFRERAIGAGYRDAMAQVEGLRALHSG